MLPLINQQARGLTPSVLRELVDNINQKSEEDYLANYIPMNPWIKRAPLFSLFVGIILQVSARWSMAPNFIGTALTMGSLMAGACLFIKFCKACEAAAAACVQNMQQYVENDLNEQWQKSRMIRWSWNVEDIPQSNGNVLHRYHIEITSMSQNVHIAQIAIQGQQIAVQQVEGQHVMMVQQVAGQQIPMTQLQGVPVQYVVVQNSDLQTQIQSQHQTQAPPQYESEAPPAYEGTAGDVITENN